MSPLPSASMLPCAGDIHPQQAWDALAADASAQLVDVRTPEEWQSVGAPALAGIGKKAQLLSLKLLPGYLLNPRFLDDLAAMLPDRTVPVYFICKSGGRSAQAAAMATELGYQTCYNIAGGFEGDPSAALHTGKASGWKATNLPWEFV
jgi:rhodanese-related sulfurtransferase